MNLMLELVPKFDAWIRSKLVELWAIHDLTDCSKKNGAQNFWVTQNLADERIKSVEESRMEEDGPKEGLAVDLIECVERLLGRIELGSDLFLRAPTWIELVDRLLVAWKLVIVIAGDLGEQSIDLHGDRRWVREL